MIDRHRNSIIEAGLRSADAMMMDEDKIWSIYSDDKVDIGERLAKIIRTLSVANPLNKPLRALSIGSSTEPQFRILETAFRGGLYLFDIDTEAMAIVSDRAIRQHTAHVRAITGNYMEVFSDPVEVERFFNDTLKRRKLDLIALHHSLYYCEAAAWTKLFEYICGSLLARKSALHAVLMAASSSNRMTTTWLYNHFAGKYFGVHNDQSLTTLKKHIEKLPSFRNNQILIDTSRVRFFVDDFGKFMKVVWMIMLYPGVHRYDARQKEEIVEFVYDTFWSARQPLIQMQHHLVVYRGIGFRGLI
ncbi:class I SAM-dependent methyltransferase [Chlorobium limicola]